MNTRIGFIVAQNTMPYIKENMQSIARWCDMVFMPFYQPEDIPDLYCKVRGQVDALLFSGAFPYRIVVEKLGPVRMPFAVLERYETALYKLMVRMSEKNRGDFSKTIIDFTNQSSGPELFNDILPEGKRPLVITGQSDSATSYRARVREIIRRYDQGLIDTAIVYFSNGIDELTCHGVDTHYLPPSEYSIRRAVENLIGQVQARYLTANQPVAGLIHCEELAQALGSGDTARAQSLRAQLRSAVEEYNRRHNMCLILNFSDASLEVVTTNQHLNNLTNRYTTCSLLYHLRQALPLRLGIFWGIGENLGQAQDNAYAALLAIENRLGTTQVSALQKDVGSDPFLLVEERETPPPPLLELPGVSKANRRKLGALLEGQALQSFSCEELAYYLNVTVRSASRIVAALEREGFVEVAHKKQEKLRGRPAKIYCFTAKADQLASLGSQ